MDCPECGAFNSMMAVECADCGADLSQVDAAAQRKRPRRRQRAEREELRPDGEKQESEAAPAPEVAAAPPDVKPVILLGGLLLGVGAVLRPAYYAYREYTVMEAAASLGLGTSGGTLEPMIAEILLAFGIAYAFGTTVWERPRLTYWLIALVVALGGWMATLNHFAFDGLLLGAIACVAGSLVVTVLVRRAARR